MPVFNYNDDTFQTNSYSPIDINIPKYPGLRLPSELYYEELPQPSTIYDEQISSPIFDIQFPKTYKVEDQEENFEQPSENLPSNDKLSKVKYLMNRLQKDLGLTKNQAAGVAGNIEVESGFKEHIRGDKGAAYGIAQWHPNRRKGADLSTYEKQVDHLIKEIKTEHTWLARGGLNKLKTAKTASEAAAIFDRDFERSSGKHLKRRQSWAERYSKYKNGGKL